MIQESGGSAGYWSSNRCSACFMYISLASSLDHCIQKGTGDGGDRPCASSNSEPRRCASSAFLPFFLHHCVPFTLFVLISSSSFLYSERPQCNATCCRPTLPTISTHSSCHHVTHTTFATTPSEHTATYANHCHHLCHSFTSHPHALVPMSHAFPSSLFHPCLTMPLPCCAVSATNTHLTVVASQCTLKTPLKPLENCLP